MAKFYLYVKDVKNAKLAEFPIESPLFDDSKKGTKYNIYLRETGYSEQYTGTHTVKTTLPVTPTPPTPPVEPPIEPPVPPVEPPTGNVIDISSKWTVPKVLTGHGEFYVDGICEARAGDNRKITFAGDKTCNIFGDMVRLYIHICNYNAQLDYDVIFNGKDSTEDDCSTDLRSRHNEGEIESEDYNRIGGIITSHEMGKWKTKREDVHKTYDTLGSGSLTSKVSNGQKHHVTYIVKDEGTKKIRIIYKINGVQQCSILDEGAPDTFFDVATIKRKSYFRIRNNGKGSITISNVKLTILP